MKCKHCLQNLTFKDIVIEIDFENVYCKFCGEFIGTLSKGKVDGNTITFIVKE